MQIAAIEDLPLVLRELVEEGFELRRHSWSEFTELDENVARTSACPVCATFSRDFIGAVLEDFDGRRVAYRAFARCAHCGHPEEF